MKKILAISLCFLALSCKKEVPETKSSIAKISETPQNLREIIKNLPDGGSYDVVANSRYTFTMVKAELKYFVKGGYCGPTAGYQVNAYPTVDLVLNSKPTWFNGGYCCSTIAFGPNPQPQQLYVRGTSKAVDPGTGKPLFDKIFKFCK